MTVTTEVLTEVWAKVLGRPVGPDDDFFAFGGDSLLALQVVAEAGARGVSIRLIDIYSQPTIRELASGTQPLTVADAPIETAGVELSEADLETLGPDVDIAYPATYLQQSLIYETELRDETFYHDVITRRIEGPFDAGALRAAVDLLAGRHEALRMSLDLSSYDVPLQVIHKDPVIPIEILPDAGIEAAVVRAGRPFDLTEPPLVRMVVSTMDSEGFQLAYGFHHVVMDGWSESRFAWELFTAYDAIVSGRPTELGPPPASAARFVALEREALTATATVDFWSRQIEGVPKVAPVSARSAQLRRSYLTLPLGLSRDDVDAAGRRFQAGAKTILTAAHLRALAELRGIDRPTTGLAVNGRPEMAGADAMIGLFLNIVPLSLPVDRADADLIADVWRFEVEMLPHRRYPAAEITRRAGRPLWDAAFNFVRFHLRGDFQRLTSITVGAPDIRDKISIPLVVDLIDDPDTEELKIGLSADPDLYPPQQLALTAETHRRMICRLVTSG